MRKIYYLLFLLPLGACSVFSESEVIMRASPEKRPPKAPYMPSTEKPLEAAPDSIETPIPLSPQIGVRVPLG